MTRKNELHARDTPQPCSRDRVVPSDVRVNNVEFVLCDDPAQTIRREKVSGVQKGKFDVRLDRAALPAGNDNMVPAAPQLFHKFDEMSLATAD